MLLLLFFHVLVAHLSEVVFSRKLKPGKKKMCMGERKES
jgi:hypothetical protein